MCHRSDGTALQRLDDVILRFESKLLLLVVPNLLQIHYFMCEQLSFFIHMSTEWHDKIQNKYASPYSVS